MKAIQEEAQKLLRIVLLVPRELGCEVLQLVLEVTGIGSPLSSGPELLEKAAVFLCQLTLHTEGVGSVEVVLEFPCQEEIDEGRRVAEAL